MPSIPKTLRLALAAALIVLITGPVASATALASPRPFPMPFRAADYGSHLPPISHATRHTLFKRTRPVHVGLRSVTHEVAKHKPSGHPAVNRTSSLHGEAHPSVHPMPAWRATRRQGYADLDVLLNELSGSNSAMSSNANNFRKCPQSICTRIFSLSTESLASQSASTNSPTYQQDAVTQLTGFQTNLQSAVNLLSQLAADKGLANYDKNNGLETMLKNVVNMNKNVLSDATTMAYNIPDLGPVLGPSEYLRYHDFAKLRSSLQLCMKLNVSSKTRWT